jgi:hypothetical protein
MDTALVLITVICAIVAVITASISWRVIREERRRAAARVLALRAELARTSPTATALEDDLDFDLAPAPREPQPARAAVLAATPAARIVTSSPVGHARAATPIVPIPSVASSAATVNDGQLFATVRRDANRTRPALLLVGSVIVAVVLGGLFLSGRVAEPAADASVTTAADVPALELLSLRHTRQGNTWTITGLVRNPENGTAVTRTNAMAFLFGPDGSFLGSGRAALDFAMLAPGDESPFVITTTASGAVTRYRVSFRAEDGRMIRHIDKRPGATSPAAEGQGR